MNAKSFGARVWFKSKPIALDATGHLQKRSIKRKRKMVMLRMIVTIQTTIL